MVRSMLLTQHPLLRSVSKKPGVSAAKSLRIHVIFLFSSFKVEYKKRLAEGLGTEKAPRILAFKNKVSVGPIRCQVSCKW